MHQKIKPIIKWTGGKYREFVLFEKFIPSFDRYIEPFFGGGGVFFALQPKTASFLNDKSADLMCFYAQMHTQDFQNSLYNYAQAWEEMTTLVDALWQKHQDTFELYIKKRGDLSKIIKNFETDINSASSVLQVLTDDIFLISSSRFVLTLKKSLLDKASRIKNINAKRKNDFDINELKDHFETGLRSGFYLYFRSVFNEDAIEPFLSPATRSANWYFVREFCYASMFRFNRKGKFNIPYGGIAYNSKKFRNKVNSLFAPATQQLFEQATFFNLDFELMLNKIDLKPSDFIFLDPPYDSEFSEYDKNAFTQKDQKRLADYLLTTVAKWMVVIKETTFIRNIYTHPSIKIVTFEKKYTYNVRGRNDRRVKHLIITNY